MANQEHLDLIWQGKQAWNRWRRNNPQVRPDLSDAILPWDLHDVDLHEADLRGANLFRDQLPRANLQGADLRGANLSKLRAQGADFRNAQLSGAKLRRAFLPAANFSSSDLCKADCRMADFTGARLDRANLNQTDLEKAILKKTKLTEANLSFAKLKKADLSRANLSAADLGHAVLRNANLSGANLTYARLIETDLEGANLSNCKIYGISAWGIKLAGAYQENLLITRSNQPRVTVDDLEVAQFVYLLMRSEKIRHVIDTVSRKVVLVLGRFTLVRKRVLEAISDKLRDLGYLPVIFDFERPQARDFTETVTILAHLSRFIIADITEPRSVPHELVSFVPTLAVPIQPLLAGSEQEYGMFADLRKYEWVLEPYHYEDLNNLLASLENRVIAPAEAKARQLEKSRARGHSPATRTGPP